MVWNCLSTVHWVVMHDSATEGREKPDNVTTAVHSWNEHKRKTFTKQRIESAWQRLRAEGCFNSSPKFVLICATALGILHLVALLAHRRINNFPVYNVAPNSVSKHHADSRLIMLCLAWSGFHRLLPAFAGKVYGFMHFNLELPQASYRRLSLQSEPLPPLLGSIVSKE